MKVKEVKSYLLNPGWGKNLLFVKITTDNGLVGWGECYTCLLYTSPSPRDRQKSRMPSSA